MDETEQPFDDEEGDEGGDDETEGEIEQELVVAAEEVVAGAEEVEGTGGEHGGDAEEQGEFGRGGALCAQGHGGHDAGSGAGGAGEDDGEDLAEADGDRFRPGNVLVGVEFLGEKFDGKDDETAGEDGPSDGEERCGEFEVEVLLLSEMRGPAAVAQGLFKETEASRELRMKLEAERKAMQAAEGFLPAAKPSKRDRRQINRFRGR